MKIKHILFICGLAGAVFGLSQDKTSSAEKPGALKAQKFLIRMDLLQKKERAAAFAKRDIFVPGSSVEPRATPSGADEAKRPNMNQEEGAVPAAPQEAALNLRYIGYIQAKSKFIALVLFEGQAVAVGEGDMLGSAWKVAKIAAGEIEIQGLDEKSQKFALEGERK